MMEVAEQQKQERGEDESEGSESIIHTVFYDKFLGKPKIDLFD